MSIRRREREKGSIMPLISIGRPSTFDNDHEGVLFPMNDGAHTVNILISRHALEGVDPAAHVLGHIERFNEYRRQFEQIASDKYDSGLLERRSLLL
jgi:hypothetical protein